MKKQSNPPPPSGITRPPPPPAPPRVSASNSTDLLCTIEAAGRDLLEWDRKYPKGTIYNSSQHTACENELTALIERFRELLAHNRDS